jgi:hypothetical protein
LLSPSIHSCIRTSCLRMLSFTAYIHAAGSLYPALSLSGSSLPLSPLSLPLSLSLALHTHAFIHSYIHSYTSILSCILTFTCKNVTSCTHTFKHGNLHTFFICAHSPFCFKLQKNSFFAETNKRSCMHTTTYIHAFKHSHSATHILVSPVLLYIYFWLKNNCLKKK